MLIKTQYFKRMKGGTEVWQITEWKLFGLLPVFVNKIMIKG